MIEVTQKAVGQIRRLMARQQMNSGGLRVGVVGGGCSGLSYSLRFDPESHPRDKIFELEGVKNLCGPKELPLSEWYDLGVFRRVGWPWLCFYEPECHPKLRLRIFVYFLVSHLAGPTRVEE